MYAGYDHFGDGTCERQKVLQKIQEKAEKPLEICGGRVGWAAFGRFLARRNSRRGFLPQAHKVKVRLLPHSQFRPPETIVNMLTQIASDGRIRLQKAK